MHTRKLKLNTITSLVYQVVGILCSFILPRLMLEGFGSEVNGLVGSIGSFLAVITFLEFGVGAVVQSALYKPLAQKDNTRISQILTSAGKFFRRLSMILLGYVLLLMVIYPLLINSEYDFVFTAALIGALSISSFAQYYFGMVNQLLLTADQRGYITYIGSLVTIVLNTVACWLLIKWGASIHLVKLISSLVFLIRPMWMAWYVHRHYQLDLHTAYDKEPITQKWNGIAQHIAAVVLDGTDTIVLSFFALTSVSIYNVYALVISGIRKIYMSLLDGIQSLLGSLWAKGDINRLTHVFEWVEWSLHTLITFLFGCTAMLLTPFVQVYTAGITDADYFQPLFGILLTLANAIISLRSPYFMIIKAAGHYKQTQRVFIIAAILNLLVSVAMVFRFGLLGVAIGTLVALTYQTVWMVIYQNRHLIHRPLRIFVRQVLVDVLTVLLSTFCSHGLEMQTLSYPSWFFLAVQTALIWLAVSLLVNLLMYPDKVKLLVSKASKKLRRFLPH